MPILKTGMGSMGQTVYGVQYREPRLSRTGVPMLIEWSHDELATSLSAATVERHLEFVDLLEEMRAGRVRYFWCDGAAFCLMVQTALESASFPVPVPLLHQYARATARGDIPALFVITVYEDAVGHPGVHAL